MGHRAERRGNFGLLRILLTVACLWCLYWGAAAWGLRSAVAGWFTTQAEQGWQADHAPLTFAAPAGGFPLSHKTRIPLPLLADPTTGTAWSADWLELHSPAIWPGRQTLRFAPTAQRLSFFDQTAVLTAQGMQADLGLAPGLALELTTLSLTSGPWTYAAASGGTALSAEDFKLAMEQQGQAQRYRFLITAQDLRPGDSLRQLLRTAPGLPETFERFALQMDVTFDRVWDRLALEQRRPQPRHIALQQAVAHWGNMRLKATGDLAVDDMGIPTGTLSLQAENWQGFLQLAADAGVITPQTRTAAENMFSMLARAGGNEADLDLTLGFKNGYVTLGPFPLAPAPRLILR